MHKDVNYVNDLTTGLSSAGSPVDGAVEPRSPYRPVANACSAGSCPTVYVDDTSDELVVQGFDISAAQVGVDVPAGEALVRIPRALLIEAMRHLS